MRAEREGQLARAADLYASLIAHCMDRPHALVEIGDALVRTAGMERAAAAYLQARAAAPDDRRALRRAEDCAYGHATFLVEVRADIRVEADGSYTTLSDDPQMLLDPDGRPLPSGWTEFVVDLTEVSPGVRPVLYAWPVDRKQGPAIFTLPPMDGPGRVRMLVRLPDRVRRLRFDPTAKAGVRFRIGSLGWVEGPDLEHRNYSMSPTAVAHCGEHAPAPETEDRFDLEAASFDVTPNDQLTLADDGGLTSIADDPQLSLTTADGRLPSGLTLIEIDVEDLSEPLEPVLYVWAEDEVGAWPLPHVEVPGPIRLAVRLPQNVRALRLDPTFRPGPRFRFGRVRFLSAERFSDRLFAPFEATPIGPRLVLQPQKDLDVDASGRYVSTGEDPQLMVRCKAGSLPTGVVSLTFDVETASAPLDPILYAWTRDGRIVAHRLPKQLPGRSSEMRVVLPADTVSLRLDPTEHQGIDFTAPRLELHPLPLVEGEVARSPSGMTVDAPPRVPRLTPLVHLSEDATGAFTVTGHDPQFAVAFEDGPMPTGWAAITLTIDCGIAVANPVLYVWSDDRILTYDLPLAVGRSTQSLLLALPARVDAMRFDPTDREGLTFRLHEFAFHRVDDTSGGVFLRVPPNDRAEEYRVWVEQYDVLTAADEARIRARVEAMVDHPLISVVMPVYNTEPRFLRRALDTVLAQLYPHWELCIADDASPNPEIRAILSEYAARDPRIKVVFREVNGHISLSSNSALELVEGPFVALMDHDDELPPHALYMVAEEILAHPHVDVIYTDEDKVDQYGRRHDPHFKTDWNEDLFLSQNMVAHLGVYRTSLVRAVGGFRAGFEGSQDYDFTLRVLPLTSPERIRHIPFVLYHWRIFQGVRTFSSNNPTTSVDTAGRAMAEWLTTEIPGAELLPIEAYPSWWRIRRPLPEKAPSVTLIIPTRDRVQLMRNLLDGVLNRTDYPDFDVIVVDNGSIEPETAAYFAEVSKDPRIRILRDDGPFNYSRLNNEAVKIARGEYVAFLNNDIETIAPDWLREMMSQAVRPEVGAVGTKLLYGSGTLQHAGVVLGIYGVAAHGHRHFAGNSIGYFGHPQLARRVSAVTAAALVMRKSLFDEIGGFDEENLAVSYNDVDLCLRVCESGHAVVYTPFATLKHLESATRGPDVTPRAIELQRIERGFMQARWPDLLDADPYYSPNLSLANEDYRLAFPPRAVKPWLVDPAPVDRLAAAGRKRLTDTPAQASTIAAIAADTVLILAGSAPWTMVSAFADPQRSDDLLPGRIVVVDNLPARDRFVGAAALKRLAVVRPDVAVTVVRDDGQDFDAGRGVELGIAAAGSAGHLVVATESGRLSAGWLDGLIRAHLATGGASVVAARAVLPTGNVEQPVRRTGALPSPLPTFEEGWERMPTAVAESLEAALTRPVIEETELPGSGVFFARRDTLALLKASRPTLFDPWMKTDARLEEFALRLREVGVGVVTTSAAAVALDAPRSREPILLWRHLADLIRLNRRAAGAADDGTIEFVCPFHRGDVLLGLQVANAAFAAGLPIRMHVAQGLASWVRDFETPFPVEFVPVPVPPAERTALEFLRAVDHVLHRPDASTRIARSHPDRGLDEMNANLVTAMLRSVGLPADTPLVGFPPRRDIADEVVASALLAPFEAEVVLLHASGGWGLKTIPDHVVERLAAMVRATGRKLVQIGGPGDQKSPACDGWIIAGYGTSRWAAIFRQSKALIGVDSWSSHMAAILDVPQVTLYGSTHPDHVASRKAFADRSTPGLLVDPAVDCSPCNSLTCLRTPGSLCAGFEIGEADLARIRDVIEWKAS